MHNHYIDFTRGFLPVDDPLLSLPKELRMWDQLGQELPKLLISDQLRKIFKELPVLKTESLKSKSEFERAMCLLSFFGHAYVWGQEQLADKIPSAIAIPWYEVAKKLGRPPVLSYSSYALHNWRRIKPNRAIELGNIALIQNFLGGRDEEWFVLVHVDIEMKAAEALQHFLPIQQAILENNNGLLLSHLETIGQCLEKMCLTLERMTEHCDPYIYYNRVRPYIHGWKDNPPLPQGIVYEGVHEFNNKPQQFRGETGAQSSIIPAFDALFGIHHRPDPLRIYLAEMREYMPEEHRKFIAELESKLSIRDYLLTTLKGGDEDIRDRYNHCINLLSRFRQTHLHFAAQYIQKQSQSSLANPTGIGTGGTPFMEYLRKHKDETLEFLI